MHIDKIAKNKQKRIHFLCNTSHQPETPNHRPTLHESLFGPSRRENAESTPALRRGKKNQK